MELITVDCNYVDQEFASSTLIVSSAQMADGTERPRGVFVECNTTRAIPQLLAAAKKNALKPENIDALIVTHIHLDHSGGAGKFLQEFPNAKIYVHPRGAKHLIDPSKLIASATQVYGENQISQLYGDILPCAKERVIEVQDGDEWKWCETTFKFKHTRGHANHHVCIWEPVTQSLFTGDSFGVSYPKINKKHGRVIIPSTSPTDFDGEAALQTVDWVLSMNPKQVVPTHYGIIPQEQIADAATKLKDQIRFSESMVKKIVQSIHDQVPLQEETVYEHIKDWWIQYYQSKKINLDLEDIRYYEFDQRINAQGLLFVAQKLAALPM